MPPVETVEEANRIAEAAMTTMARLGIAAKPTHYEIWFDHLAGSYPKLSKRIREIEKEGLDFSDLVLAEIHETFFGTGRHAEVVDQTCQRIEGTMAKLLDQVGGMSEGTGSYGDKLTDFSAELDRTDSLPDLSGMITELLDETRAMQSRAQELEGNLTDSTKLIQGLRTDLAKAQREAHTDGLTGIANRKYFDLELETRGKEASANGEPLTLLLTDIDHFKKFNDTHGHQVGDQVLRLVAQLLTQHVKGRDLAARYGGEEFAVILPQTGADGAVKLAENIRVNIAKQKIRLKSSGTELGNITLSIGCAEYQHGEPVEDVIARADAALYRAKDAGRNRVMAADPPPAVTAAA